MRMLLAEADFVIHGIFSYSLFGQTFWITTTHVSMLIVDLIILVLLIAARRKFKHPDEIPGFLQNIFEMIVEMLDNMVKGIMGKNAKKYANYIGTVFMFILLSNISGILGLRAPTADYGVTLALGVISFALIQVSGVLKNGVKHFTDFFQPLPILFPINVIGDIATPISLSLRLFGNLLSGTIISGLWYGMMPIFCLIGIPAFLHVYFDLFSGAIQTYVFCMLTMVFINGKIADE